MIKIYRAKKESRRRDKKRCRWIFEIGRKKYHITPSELFQVADYINQHSHILWADLEPRMETK